MESNRPTNTVERFIFKSSRQRAQQVKEEFNYPNTTSLRRNPTYYRLYCVGLNTFFASLFPLLALTFLNIRTLMALRQIGRAATAAERSSSEKQQHSIALTRSSPRRGGASTSGCEEVDLRTASKRNSAEQTRANRSGGLEGEPELPKTPDETRS